ncbi:MAG TPA: PBP1A family penicillin-binding protein [Acetobacteraceae bacterium]|nr:PBP1A family penicillin-binding protein [Acetobacteraceae bacterium]
MTKPIRAGEKLAPPSTDTRSADNAKGGRREPASPRKPRRGPFRRFARGVMGGVLAIGLLVAAVGGIGGYVAFERFGADLPDVDGLRSYQPPVMSRVYAGDGRLMAELAAERRIFVPYSAIPDLVKRAFVSAEDQNFWTHPGVDPLAIARAAVFDLTHMSQGRRPLGASTITQQVAKNMLLDNQVSLARKAREALLAMRIEQTLSKQRILELYLNEIYLGMGSYGVAAAAQAYFNKPLDRLTLSEAAFLAALPKAPNNYNPSKFAEAAKVRRDWVLDRMTEDHAITAAQAQAAKAEPIVPAEFHRPQPIPGADWFAEEVRRQLVTQFGPDVTTQGGLMVRTSLDPTLQIVAERAVRDGLIAYDRKLGGWRGPVTHLEGGAVLAKDWVGPLGQVARPAGMLPDWKLAVVLGTTDSEARLGWIDGQPRTGTLTLSEVAWARPVRDGKPGPAPRRITDVVQQGDVVMVEPNTTLPTPVAQAPVGQAPVAQAKYAKAPPPASLRLALRQIPAVQGALVSLDPTTGRVLAMVGGWSFEGSQFNRATQAQRQPGSSFKPFVYLTALEKGVSPSQRFLDAPVVMDTAAGRWRPNNFEMEFGGPTPLRIALEKSLNLVTLRVAQTIGMEPIAENAIAFHEVENMPRVLPAALGAVETTVLREAGAYASLAAGGREVVPTLIDSVQDPDGHVVWRPTAISCDNCSDQGITPSLTDQRKEIADPQSVFQLVTMMQGVTTRGTGAPVAAGLGHPIAGKTGTTQDFSDAWFSGFTPDLVTTVWVGFDNPASLGDNQTGAHVAGPIWHDFMAVALKNRPVLQFQAPPGVTMAAWDSGSGTVTDAFKPDQVPGASRPLGGAVAAGPAADSASPADSRSTPGGVDSGLGGIY